MFAAGVIALLAAVLFAIGSVAQQRAAAAYPPDEVGGVELLRRLVRRPLWWLGFGGDAGGYVCQAIALGLGSLLLVQPLLVASLIFALPLAARWTGARMSAADWGWALALVAALAVFMVVGDPTQGVDHAPVADWVATGVVLGVVVGVCLGLAAVRRGVVRATALAVATGVCYGLAAALTKTVMDLLVEGPVELVTHWETYGLVAAGALGVFLQQQAFQAGALEASLPAMTVAEPLVAAGIGIAILQEEISWSGTSAVVLTIAIAVMVAGTVALSRSSARFGVGGPAARSADGAGLPGGTGRDVHRPVPGA